MVHRLVSIAAPAAAVAVVALSAPAAPFDGALVFTDPAGDSKGALDVTKVAVSHADGAGTFTIEVVASKPAARRSSATPPPRPTLTTNILSLSLDVDRNAATGAGGFEYVFQNVGGRWDARAWDGAKLQPATFTPTTFFNGYAVYQWTIRRADVGEPTGFAFRVSAGAIVDSPGGLSNLGPDSAPDSGTWVYDLLPPPPPPTTAPVPPLRPVIGPPFTTPARAAAGKRFVVAFRVTRSDTGAPLSSGTMICDPSIGGAILAHAESFSSGTARLAFVVPRGSQGKLLRVKVTIRVRGQSATRVAAIRVR